MCFAPQRRALFSNIAIPKLWCVLCAFWLGNVLGATTAYTFWTSQFLKVLRSWGVLRILNFEMFFPPQRRALFQRLIFQKCSGVGVFCMFLLRNVFRATTACNFSSLVWPEGCPPATLASLLFDPPEPQIIGKTQCFATFLPFFRFFLFSDLLFSSLIFSPFLWSSLTLPTSAFPSVHIVGSLTSKLHSVIILFHHY